MKSELKLWRPFSPPIGQIKMPQSLIDSLNQYTEELTNNKMLDKKLDYGSDLVGQVSQEIGITKEFLKKGLLEYFGFAVKNYINAYDGKSIKEFKLLKSWIVRQYKTEYNPIHWHSGHISGVAYLKLPDSFGESFQKNKKNNRNGKIVFSHGSKQFLSKSIMEFEPIVGDLYIFPNYLMHTVYPFYSEGERRSVSFNSIIDNAIFDDNHD